MVLKCSEADVSVEASQARGICRLTHASLQESNSVRIYAYSMRGFSPWAVRKCACFQHWRFSPSQSGIFKYYQNVFSHVRAERMLLQFTAGSGLREKGFKALECEAGILWTPFGWHLAPHLVCKINIMLPETVRYQLAW